MRADKEFQGIRAAFREAMRDYEPILSRTESRTACATCTASGWFDAYGETVNPDCPTCQGRGSLVVESSGVFPALVQILRGTQRYETKQGVIHAGNAILHLEDSWSGLVENARELEFQGVKWQVLEVTRTPFRRRAWLTVPCRRKE